ncbi:hypothetical protein [Nocardia sp. NPDC051570]|uniref:hypothetical protein n=1 Tax=Nocardia sp. NPDC051570 TaxID=3364324 RepID=UPI00378C3780
MGKHQAKQNPLCSMRLAMLSATALITAGISTQHGSSPANQATALTASWTDLNARGQAVEPVTPSRDPQPVAAPDEDQTPSGAMEPAAPALPKAPPADHRQTNRPGVPLTFDPAPDDTPAAASTGRTSTHTAHHPRNRDTTAAQTGSAPADLGSLLTNLGAALNAGASVARTLSSGSAAPMAEQASTSGSDCADDTAAPAANTPMNATAQTPAGAIDLGSLLADLGAVLKAGATAAQVLDSGSSVADTGSTIAGTGSALLAPLSAAAAGSA